MFSKILRFFKKDPTPANTPEAKNRILEAIAQGETLEAIALIAAEGHRDALLWQAQWVSGEKAFQAGDLQAEAWFRTQNRINHAILMYCNPEQPAPYFRAPAYQHLNYSVYSQRKVMVKK